MNDPLAIATVVAALVAGAVGAIAALRPRRAGTVVYLAAAGAESVAVILAGAVVIGLVRGARVDGVATFLGYLLALVLVFPIAVVWAVGDDTRWGGLVLTIAGVSVAVVVLRMQTLWLGPA